MLYLDPFLVLKFRCIDVENILAIPEAGKVHTDFIQSTFVTAAFGKYGARAVRMGDDNLILTLL